MFKKSILLIILIISAGIFVRGTGIFKKSNLISITSFNSLADVLPKVEGLENKSKVEEKSKRASYNDIEPQKPLENPPQIIKAIYATGWSSGNEKKVDYFLNLIRNSELNAIVIDIKDYSGYILYDTNLELPNNYQAVEVRIPQLNTLIKRLHGEGIYVIGRLSVFQDPRLALARPDLAMQSSSTGKIWKDRQGLSWIDPAATEAWNYNIEIAKDAFARGFDEINFDYIRFASDGNLRDIIYPFWDKKIHKQKIIASFFEYVRNQLPDKKISADLFGLVTVNPDDLGIGQYLEDALPFFDYIAPMVYPSHYFTGFLGYRKPAEYPYEVIRYSIDTALDRIKEFKRKIILQNASTTTPPSRFNPNKLAKLRPWLQDFDLGAVYDAPMVRKQMQAVYDSATNTAPNDYSGWMLWNASNIYTQEALE